MMRRHRRRSNLGLPPESHYANLLKQQGQATQLIKNAQNAARAGRCSIANSTLIDAAVTVGRYTSEVEALSAPGGLAVENLSPVLQKKITSIKSVLPKLKKQMLSINAALEKTRDQLKKSCGICRK